MSALLQLNASVHLLRGFMAHTRCRRIAARIAALLCLVTVAACDPGWVYRAPDGTAIAGKPWWFAVAGPDSTALAVHASDFTNSLSVELTVTNTASTPLLLSPAALVVLDEAGEPIPVEWTRDDVKAMAEVAAGATYHAERVLRTHARLTGFRRLRVELPARRQGPAFLIAVPLVVDQ